MADGKANEYQSVDGFAGPAMLNHSYRLSLLIKEDMMFVKTVALSFGRWASYNRIEVTTTTGGTSFFIHTSNSILTLYYANQKPDTDKDF